MSPGSVLSGKRLFTVSPALTVEGNAPIIIIMKKGLIACCTITLLVLSSCIGGQYLMTEGIDTTSGITGTFRLILFGGAYQDDWETVAILDGEGDNYEIVPFAREYRYSVSEGQAAETAFARAEHFARSQTDSIGVLYRRIMDDTGGTVGYEIRPLYNIAAFGMPDIIEVDYYLQEDGSVRVVVRLKEEVERRRQDGDRDFPWGH